MVLETDPDIVLNPSRLEVFYKKYFRYFNTLSISDKTLFIERCLDFISEKNIVGASGFVADNRVKALVAASAVQLTLGLETWMMNYFDTVVIHPDDYNNEATGLKYSGETNLGGYVMLSWKKFLKGYSINDDNLNLGLHEFSHALRFNSVKGEAQDYFVENYFDKWLVPAYDAYYDIKEGKKSIFRQYGGSNINEFVSVCIEHYFESPLEIEEHYPFLFHSTGILLNQQGDGIDTQLSVRETLLYEQNNLLPGFKEYNFKTPVVKGSMIAVLVVLIISIFVSQPLAILLGALLLFLALRSDFLYTSLRFHATKIHIQKGFFFFGWRRHKNFPLSCLISVRAASAEVSNTTWHMIYYDIADSYFYEETVESKDLKNAEFIHDLALNKVAYLK